MQCIGASYLRPFFLREANSFLVFAPQFKANLLADKMLQQLRKVLNQKHVRQRQSEANLLHFEL